MHRFIMTSICISLAKAIHVTHLLPSSAVWHLGKGLKMCAHSTKERAAFLPSYGFYWMKKTWSRCCALSLLVGFRALDACTLDGSSPEGAIGFPFFLF